MWDLIVSVPDRCLSFYFECLIRKTDYSNNIATSFWAKKNEFEIIRLLNVG